ncbi:MAG: SBBP repeat-containing protein [candidate division WOR-3 bacterium]
MRLKYYILTNFLLLLNLLAQTQRWVARYNGPANLVDGGNAIVVEPSGNVYVTGRSGDSPSTFECTTIKYDSMGNERWVRRYHFAPSFYNDTGWGIAIDPFGYLYVILSSTTPDSYDDIAVIKYDSLGNLIWVRRYNGPGNDYDWPFDIAVDCFSNVYITGRSIGDGTGFDYVVIKLDSAGNEKWIRRYNGSGNNTDEAYSIAVDRHGNVFVTGVSINLVGNLDFVTIKYDSLGNERWVKTYNSPNNLNEYGATLAIDSSSNVYVFGGTWSLGTFPSDYILIKYNAMGDTVWTRRYNGPANGDDRPAKIVFDLRGYVYVTGSSYTDASSQTDFCTVKYDTNGNVLWVRRYNGPGSGNDQPKAITVDSYGNIYVAGKCRGPVDDDYATVVYDSIGHQLTAQVYDGPGDWEDAAQDIVVDPHGHFFITGFSGGINSAYDFTTICYSLNWVPICSNSRKIIVSSEICLTLLGRNSSYIYKNMKIYDIAGRLIDPSNLKTGIYFIKMDARNWYKVIKID